jgi:hypothetical protein
MGDLMLEFDTVAAAWVWLPSLEAGEFERIRIYLPSAHSTRLRTRTAFVLFSFADWEARVNRGRYGSDEQIFGAKQQVLLHRGGAH